MSYAQRPVGDYRTYGYAGDPGFLSSLWKGIKKVAKFIPGPIGMLAGAAGAVGAIGKMQPPPGQFPQRQGSMPGMGYGAVDALGRPWMTTGMGRSLTKGAPPNVPYGPGAAAGVACPTGYHLAKDGSGRMVRNRRMNIANPRALRRAMRRVQGFEKLAKRTITFTRRTKMKKRAS